MSVVVIREDTGQFLNQVRGEGRGWVSDLSKAQVFETVGKAKIAWNHATAFHRRANAYRDARLKRDLPVSGDAYTIPEFATRGVRLVMELL
jgi:hypothetical protein